MFDINHELVFKLINESHNNLCDTPNFKERNGDG